MKRIKQVNSQKHTIIYIRNVKKKAYKLLWNQGILSQLKHIVFQKMKIPINHQILFWKGKQLQKDSSCLCFANNSIIHVVDKRKLDQQTISIFVKIFGKCQQIFTFMVRSQMKIKDFQEKMLNKAGDDEILYFMIYTGRILNPRKSFKEELVQDQSEILYINKLECMSKPNISPQMPISILRTKFQKQTAYIHQKILKNKPLIRLQEENDVQMQNDILQEKEKKLDVRGKQNQRKIKNENLTGQNRKEEEELFRLNLYDFLRGQDPQPIYKQTDVDQIAQNKIMMGSYFQSLIDNSYQQQKVKAGQNSQSFRNIMLQRILRIQTKLAQKVQQGYQPQISDQIPINRNQMIENKHQNGEQSQIMASSSNNKVKSTENSQEFRHFMNMRIKKIIIPQQKSQIQEKKVDPCAGQKIPVTIYEDGFKILDLRPLKPAQKNTKISNVFNPHLFQAKSRSQSIKTKNMPVQSNSESYHTKISVQDKEESINCSISRIQVTNPNHFIINENQSQLLSSTHTNQQWQPLNSSQLTFGNVDQNWSIQLENQTGAIDGGTNLKHWRQLSSSLIEPQESINESNPENKNSFTGQFNQMEQSEQNITSQFAKQY